jgi:hypothetical protein
MGIDGYYADPCEKRDDDDTSDPTKKPLGSLTAQVNTKDYVRHSRTNEESRLQLVTCDCVGSSIGLFFFRVTLREHVLAFW